MSELVFSHNQLKQKTASGIVYLLSRRFIYQLILTLSNIVLARIFQPNLIGTFGIISFIILNIGIFTNFGLNQALIQKNQNTKKDELQAMFTLLLLTALLFIAIIYFLAPVIGMFYQGKLSLIDIFWMRLFSAYFLFVNLMSISQGLLEKKLAYKKLVIGELSLIFFSQLLVIVFSLLNMGIGSFVLGNLLGAAISMCIMFYLQPWVIGIKFNFKILKPYLNFGLNCQLSSFVSAINTAVIPVFIGFTSGPAAVAYIMTAGGIRQGVIAITEVFQKLAFGVSSRTINNKEWLKTFYEKMIKFSCLTSFPLIAIVMALAPNFIAIIYTAKWLPMLPALYLSLLAGIFLVLSNLFVQFLLALGHAKTVRNIYGFWAIMQWVLTIPLVKLWGYNGVVVASLIVSATFFIPMIILKKEINFKLGVNFWPYLILSVFTYVFVLFLSQFMLVNSFIKLCFISFCGLIFYLLLIFLFDFRKLVSEFKDFFQAL